MHFTPARIASPRARPGQTSNTKILKEADLDADATRDQLIKIAIDAGCEIQVKSETSGGFVFETPRGTLNPIADYASRNVNIKEVPLMDNVPEDTGLAVVKEARQREGNEGRHPSE